MDLNPLKKMPYSFIIFLKCKHYLWEVTSSYIKINSDCVCLCDNAGFPKWRLREIID